MNATSRASDPNTPRIVGICVSHLDREVSLFKKFIEVSESIQNLVGIHSETPAPAIEKLTQSLKAEADSVSASRAKLQTDLANCLGLRNSQVSVKKLIDSLDGELAQMIAERRAQLLDMESQIRQMNRTNTLILQQSLDLYERIVVGLTGQEISAPTYSASGQLGTADGANLLQTDC